MTGTNDGILYLKGIDETSSFSLMTARGPRDHQSMTTPLQYSYQILLDRSRFEDSSPLVAGDTVRKKDRLSLIPGFGAMISESIPNGYVFSSCSLGVGAIKETMTHTTPPQIDVFSHINITALTMLRKSSGSAFYRRGHIASE